MLELLSLLLFILCTLVFSQAFGKIGQDKRTIQKRLQFIGRDRNYLAALEQDAPAEDGGGDASHTMPLRERLLEPLIEKLRQVVDKNMGKQKQEQMTRRLYEAGSPFGLKAVDFLLLQLAIAAITFTVFLLLFAIGSEDHLKGTMFAIIAGMFALVYPNMYLNAKKKKRVKNIEKDMPDFFDMVNVSIEAGMGLDGALKRVCTQMRSPLSAEFKLAIEDMKLGKSRKHAFEELRNRIPSEFFKSVINSIIQADQMGIGMTKVLRAQTERMREQKKQAVKEQAMKAPVKMLIPMVLFIFPTLFIILLGPVIINLVTKWL
ncbi:type II secretion system F family protein [Bacillus marasmi]|uniref:type II secretion system F family protein n=1 Tax=Bacillus marasmi TaxID=1926279 RepID=UPI0011CCCA11|nr:type II secretion system F family protein [Bacillus marasmi]